MKALVLGDQSYADLLAPFMEVHMDDQEDYDVVMFTGGADISPDLYGELKHHSTVTHPVRDLKEVQYYNRFKNKAKFVGICRGAQLLCAMNGDRVIQDVTNHSHCTHPVSTFASHHGTFNVSGDHHQMMSPELGELLAYSNSLSRHYLNGDGRNIPYDPDGGVEAEVVWYAETQSLCVQYHPEWMDEASEGRNYFNYLIKEYIL